MLAPAFVSRRHIRHIRQAEMYECGSACLAMIASYHGLRLNMAALRRGFSASSRGTTLRTLLQQAKSLGFNGRAVRADVDELAVLQLPAILHWDASHYVVLDKVARRGIRILDPAGATRWVTRSEYGRRYTGIAVELTPGIDFSPEDLRIRLKLSDLWHRLQGFKRAAAQAVLLSFVLQLLTLLPPYYVRIAIDNALPSGEKGLIAILGVGFIILTIASSFVLLIRQSLLLNAGTSFGYGLSLNVARRLFRLPITWFSQRLVGDILSRFQSVAPVRKLLAEDTPAAVIDGILAASTVAVLSFYSVVLSALAACALAGVLAVKLTLLPRTLRYQDAVIAAGAREQSTLIETVRGIRVLRLAGREQARFAVWHAQMSETINNSLLAQRLANLQGSVQVALIGVELVVSTWIVLTWVADGKQTLGMAFAIFAYKAQLTAAGLSLINRLVDAKAISLHLDRLSDIALAVEDKEIDADVSTMPRLRGKLELRNVTFRYGPDQPLLLKNVSICIEPGDFITITGASGCGKSTLLALMLGVIEPTAGEILVDNRLVDPLIRRTFNDQSASVLQGDGLFTGSLRDNITLFDESPDLERLERSAEAAAIHDDILSMPMAYDSYVGETGAALSGGQQQRVLMARALYRKPRLLFMDEGTSHLDAANEQRVNSAISEMGITRVVVAHRAETIAISDQVYELVDGELIKRR